MGIIETTSPSRIVVLRPSSADESTPFTATNIFLVSGMGVFGGRFCTMSCNNSDMVVSDVSGVYCGNVFFAPPSNLIIII